MNNVESAAIPAYYRDAVTGEIESTEVPCDCAHCSPDSDDRDRVVRWFCCQRCDGHGAMVDHDDVTPRAILCPDCHGTGRLGATEDDIENAESIGSDNPFCRHEWAGGDEEYDRCYCMRCGADGDA